VELGFRGRDMTGAQFLLTGLEMPLGIRDEGDDWILNEFRGLNNRWRRGLNVDRGSRLGQWFLRRVLAGRAAAYRERQEGKQGNLRRIPSQHYGRGILPSGLGQVNSKSNRLSRNGAEACNGTKAPTRSELIITRATVRPRRRDAVRRDPSPPA